MAHLYSANLHKLFLKIVVSENSIYKCRPLFYASTFVYIELFFMFHTTGYYSIYKIQDRCVCHLVTLMKIYGFNSNYYVFLQS